MNVEHKEVIQHGVHPQDSWGRRCACGNDWPCSGTPSRAVEQRSTVDVTGAREALVVGPDEVLIVTFAECEPDELQHIVDRFKDAGLRNDQFLLIAGRGVGMAKAPRVTASAYVRPQATQG